jgi:putative ABC transport system permease protein
MSIAAKFRIWMRDLFHVEQSENELDSELRFDLEQRIDANIRAGMTRKNAELNARSEFGSVALAKEECRDERGTQFFQQTWQDVRFGLRMLRKSPGFTTTAILTLALGIGANTAIFSMMNTVLLQSLPVRNPSELVMISSMVPKSGENDSFSYPMYQDIRDHNDAFAGVLAVGGAQMNVSYSGESDRVSGRLVSGNYFDVLGVHPWIGRLFTQDDDRTPGANSVAVLSYGFWERRFGKDPSLIGKTMLINGHVMTVIGVSPPGFYGTDLDRAPDLFVPLMMTPVFNPLPANRLQSRSHWWITLMARRKPGVSLAQAQASLEVLYQQLLKIDVQELPPDASEYNRKQFFSRTIQLAPGNQGGAHLQQVMAQPLLMLFAVTGIVLLILCANLANLLLARASARGQETAVRLALGAGRFRLLRQWLTESLLISVLGGVAGIFIAMWVNAALIGFIPEDFRSNLNSPLGWRVFAFTLAVSVLVGAVVGLAPALRASRNSVPLVLRGESRNSAGRKLLSLRGILIVLQVALSLPLLIGAGLFLHSLENLRGMDTGFTRDHVLLASVNPMVSGYSPEATRNFYNQLLAQVRALPGVQAASVSTESPISGSWDIDGVVVEGYQPREGERMGCQNADVSTDFFRTLGIPFVAGRDFSDKDKTGAPKVTIINETMAHYFFGNSNPIGRKIGTDKIPDIEIVGVVRDAKYSQLREEKRRHFYIPMMQQPRLFETTLHVRAPGDPAALAEMVRAQVKSLDSQLPLYDVKTLAAQIDESIVTERLITWLSTIFGLLATLLAAVGLYGVVAFSVTRRTREIGVRIALGAMPGDVLWLFLKQMAVLVGAGVIIGVGCALAATRLLNTMLYNVKPADPLAFIAAGMVLIATATLAAYLPARRATHVDPITALRYE